MNTISNKNDEVLCSYSFMKLFVTILKSDKISAFYPNNFVSFLRYCRKYNFHQDFFSSFPVQKAEEFYYCENLDKTIATLIREHILWIDRSSIIYTIHIKEDISLAKIIKNDTNLKKNYKQVREIVKEFLNFQKELISYDFKKQVQKEKKLSKTLSK